MTRIALLTLPSHTTRLRPRPGHAPLTRYVVLLGTSSGPSCPLSQSHLPLPLPGLCTPDSVKSYLALTRRHRFRVLDSSVTFKVRLRPALASATAPARLIGDAAADAANAVDATAALSLSFLLALVSPTAAADTSALTAHRPLAATSVTRASPSHTPCSGLSSRPSSSLSPVIPSAPADRPVTLVHPCDPRLGESSLALPRRSRPHQHRSRALDSALKSPPDLTSAMPPHSVLQQQVMVLPVQQLHLIQPPASRAWPLTRATRAYRPAATSVPRASPSRTPCCGPV